jgi:hypothetical protein
VNTALISHILNQRLKKGEIWPSWWGGAFLLVLSVVPMMTLLNIGPLSWPRNAMAPAAIAGRALYVVVLCIWVLEVLQVLASARQWLSSQLERSNLELTALATGRARSAVLGGLGADLSTLALRMMRLIPLLAIAAASEGIAWSDAALATAWLLGLSSTLLVVMYAAATLAPRSIPVAWVLGPLAALWAHDNIDASVILLETLRDHVARHALHFALISTTSILTGWAAVTVRARYTRSWRRVRRRRVRPPKALRHVPEATLLLRGLQGGLGVIGSTLLWLALFSVCLIMVWVPLFGWMAILLGTALFVPLIMNGIWRSYAWEDVYLASGSPESWRRTVSTAVLIAAAPALPALMLGLLTGRTHLFPYSLIAFAQALTRTTSIGVSLLLVPALGIVEVALAVLAFVACVWATLVTWTDRTTNTVGLSSRSGKEAVLLIFTFIGIAIVSVPAGLDSEPTFYAGVALAIFSFLAVIAALIAALSWRNLRLSLPRLMGKAPTDFRPSE